MSPHVGMAVLSSPIPLLQRVCQRCLLILACMCGREFEVAFFSICSLLALAPGMSGNVLAGVEIGGLSCVFLYFGGC